MAIQSWIDDSGTKGSDGSLVLAGLIGPAERLAEVADQWDRELFANIPGRIRYFKADEARHLSGEFSHWREEARDEKVRRLAAIIDRDDLMILMTAVDLYAFGQMELIAGVPIADARHHPMNQPYILALYTVMVASGMEARRRNPTEKAEVIFDTHDKFRHIFQEQYPTLLEVLPEPLRAVMPIQPWFRDDKDFVLLQCADLLAGHIRMTSEKDPGWRLAVDFKQLRVSPFSVIFDHERLKAMAEARIKLPLELVKVEPFNLPINGSGTIPLPPLAYFDVDQPVVCSVSRESLPKEARRWVAWDE